MGDDVTLGDILGGIVRPLVIGNAGWLPFPIRERRGCTPRKGSIHSRFHPSRSDRVGPIDFPLRHHAKGRNSFALDFRIYPRGRYRGDHPCGVLRCRQKRGSASSSEGDWLH